MVDRNIPVEAEVVDADYAPLNGNVLDDDLNAELEAIDDRPLWKRILSTEPAMLRGFIAALVMLLTAYGVSVSPDQSAATVAFAGVLLAMVQAWSTRQSVVPVDKAVAHVEAVERSADEAIQLAYEAGATDAQLSGPARNVGVA